MPTAEKTKPAVAVDEEKRKILQKDFLQASFAFNRWSVTLPYGWDFTDCLDPEFWTNVAHLLAPNATNGQKSRIGDVIEIRTIDHAWYAELYVRAVRESALIVAVLRAPVQLVPVKGMELPKGSKLDVRFNTSKAKYEVIRISDGSVIGEGFDLKETALNFVDRMET
jgi:hypothetical protein